MEKVANAAPKISNNYGPIGMTSTGTTSGVLCVDNGPITQAAPVPNSNGSVMEIRQHIRNLTPFECDNWDTLCSAVIEEYDTAWRTELIWIIGGFRQTLPRIKKMKGSWNFPLRWVSDDMIGRHEAYKVFRKRWYLNKDNYIQPQLRYEFHEAPVVSRQWLQAEISGSPGLSGLTKKEEGGTGGKFHMLWNKRQAEVYLSNRADVTDWFTSQEAVIVPVEPRSVETIDLVYVPPKLFVWGIDSKEMYVKL